MNTQSLAAFYVGRLIAGFGLGAAAVVFPAFNSEMAPKELKAQVGCFFQLFYTFGILTSYWVDYGVSIHVRPSSRQWQIPIGLQIIPARLIFLGTFTLKESTRWLTSVGRHDEAWRSLAWIRASDCPDIVAEMDEIREGVARELKEKEGFKLWHLLRAYDGSSRLAATFFLVFLAQQSTGNTAFAYFAPQYFKLIAGDDPQRSLPLTGIFGAVKVVACAIFIFLVSERVGRLVSLVWGATLIAALHMSTGAVNKTHPPSEEGVSAASVGTVVLIYLFMVVYNMSWGPLLGPYVSEIFLRALATLRSRSVLHRNSSSASYTRLRLIT